MPDETAATTPGAAPGNDIPLRLADVSDRITDLLMAGKIDGVGVEPTTTSDPPAPPAPAAPTKPAADPATPPVATETPAAPAATPPAAPAKPAADPATPPAAEPPAAVIELPDVPHPFDDPEDPSIDDVTDGRQTKIRERFSAQREKLRAAREEGQFGRLMLDEAAQGGIEPAVMAQLVTLTAKANRGDQAARTELATVMQRLGVQAPSPAPAPQPKPDLDTVTDAVYREMFKDDVESLNITEERARALAKKIANDRIQRSPAPSQPTAVPPQAQQPPAPARPAAPAADPIQQAALAELGRVDAQFEAAFKKVDIDFAPIRDEAQRRIQARVRTSGPIPPIRWAYEFAQVVRQVQVEKAKTQAPAARPAVPGALRASSTPGTPGKSDWREAAVDSMLTGKWDG